MRILKTSLVAFVFFQIHLAPAWADDSVEETGKLMESAAGKSTIVIQGSRNLSGSIRILPVSGDQVEISYRKQATAGSETQAKRFIELIDLKLAQDSPDRIVLSIRTPSDAPWAGSDRKVALDVFVQVPEKMKIECDMRFLSLDIKGSFRGVTVRSGFSKVNLEGIRGEINIATSFATVNLRDITGSIRAETRYADIEASDITVPQGSAIFQNVGGTIRLRGIRGPVEAYTSYSPIEASDIDAEEGSVVFRTSYSPIEVSDISGELICETSFSKLKVANAYLTHGQSKLETSYSPISAEFRKIEEGQLFVYNNYNNIDLSIPASTSSVLVVSVDQGGKIHSTNLPVKPTYLDATRLEGQIGSGLARIELKVSGIGTIDLEGR